MTLGGRWYGRYGTAPCPVCQPERRRDQNALSLADGQNGLLLHCKKSSCAFRDILAALGLALGRYRPPDPENLALRDSQRQADLVRRADQARTIWNEAQPIGRTPAEAYLQGRAITCALPKTLRFHSAVWHGPSARRFPAMISLVEGGNGFAIHRTYLRADGAAKADISPNKSMLGAVSGGAVRLSEGGGPLVVAEGIETSLSLASGLVVETATVWAALSTSGMKSLHLPSQPQRLTIATDGERAGREAGQVLAERAFALGWDVMFLPAQDGKDWNDILRAKVGVTST